MDAWLESIEPRVIDGWLLFAAIEPEQFAGDRAPIEMGGFAGVSGGETRWIKAKNAAKHFAAKMFRR